MREQRVNPRALGTNPTAGTASDVRRVAAEKRRALLAYRREFGSWCTVCDDEPAGVNPGDGWRPCPQHRPMTSREAYAILHP